MTVKPAPSVKKASGKGCAECGSPSRHKKDCSKAAASKSDKPATVKNSKISPLDFEAVKEQQREDMTTDYVAKRFNLNVQEVIDAFASDSYRTYKVMIWTKPKAAKRPKIQCIVCKLKFANVSQLQFHSDREHQTSLFDATKGMTLKEQLAKFLRDGHGFVASGDLQRIDWYDNRGRLVTPSNISRRLRETCCRWGARSSD
jgi:hypothetical protein